MDVSPFNLINQCHLFDTKHFLYQDFMTLKIALPGQTSLEELIANSLLIQTVCKI